MGSKFVDARLTTKVVVAVIVMATLSAIGMGIANGPSGAASSPSAGATVKAHTTAASAKQAENPILYFAAREKGVANCAGGGTWYGPTDPASSGCSVPGFGCMSLAQFAVYQGTNGKVKLPINNQKGVGGTFIPPSTTGSLWAGLQPGDVTYWGGTMNFYYHSGIYAGNGLVWDAVGTETVGLRSFATLLDAPYSYNYLGGKRFTSVPLPAVSTAFLPVGSLYSSSNKAYTATLHATGGRVPYRWSRTKGSLPNGLTMSTGGVISGRATKTGTFTFVVQVSDPKTSDFVAVTATRTLAIKITS